MEACTYRWSRVLGTHEQSSTCNPKLPQRPRRAPKSKAHASKAAALLEDVSTPSVLSWQLSRPSWRSGKTYIGDQGFGRIQELSVFKETSQVAGGGGANSKLRPKLLLLQQCHRVLLYTSVSQPLRYPLRLPVPSKAVAWSISHAFKTWSVVVTATWAHQART